MRENGPLTIRDIDDDVLVEKDHPWASRKPSKRALQLAFYTGDVTVSARSGMLKTYELMNRHFGWEKPPKPASEREIIAYLLDRALRSQGLISLEFGLLPRCWAQAADAQADRGAGCAARSSCPSPSRARKRSQHWATPETLDAAEPRNATRLVHILSPFDPLIIQRKRLQLFFDYDHRFEAYVPKEKRVFGYFALPVLVGDEIVAAIDLKTDREGGKLLVQQWSWVGKGEPRAHKARIEAELHRFERFQLAFSSEPD